MPIKALMAWVDFPQQAIKSVLLCIAHSSANQGLRHGQPGVAAGGKAPRFQQAAAGAAQALSFERVGIVCPKPQRTIVAQ